MEDNIFVWLDSAELIFEATGNLDLAQKIREIRDEYLSRLEKYDTRLSNDASSGGQ